MGSSSPSTLFPRLFADRAAPDVAADGATTTGATDDDGTAVDAEAVCFPDGACSYAQLAGAVALTAGRLDGASRAAVWATPTLDMCIGVLGALAAGVPVIPINPRSGPRELDHIVRDSAPDLVLAAAGLVLPESLSHLRRSDVVSDVEADRVPDVEADRVPGWFRPVDADDRLGLIVYTSGTTGPPKGVLLTQEAIAANLDALIAAWAWTPTDVLVHALPMFHLHGLVLGMLGPIRVGGALHHLGAFTPAGIAAELAGPATMLFGVPTMYHRLGEAAEGDPHVAAALSGARLLVSGSAGLPASEHERFNRLTGRRVLERYGLTETMILCAEPAVGGDPPPAAGTVGPPLRGVELRLVDDDGTLVPAGDERIGEVEARGPSLFDGYLNLPGATADAFRADGWFRTGDVATHRADGWLSLVGRRSTDLIKSGGYKIGAGEIESVLLEHPAVAEVAITGAPDPDLGERIVAWVVPTSPSTIGNDSDSRGALAAELVAHVGRQLAPHKRPREVRFLESLPRNPMGKITKTALHAEDPPDEPPPIGAP